MRTFRDTYREMEVLRRQMNDLFDDLGFDGTSWPFSRIAFVPARGARVYPLLNLAEDRDHLFVEALAPGINTEDLQVTITGDTLTIAGEKTALSEEVKPEAWHRNERGAGKFVRTVQLPCEVESEKIEAEYKDGLLRLTMPKSAHAKPKQISINVN